MDQDFGPAVSPRQPGQRYDADLGRPTERPVHPDMSPHPQPLEFLPAQPQESLRDRARKARLKKANTVHLPDLDIDARFRKMAFQDLMILDRLPKRLHEAVNHSIKISKSINEGLKGLTEEGLMERMLETGGIGSILVTEREMYEEVVLLGAIWPKVVRTLEELGDPQANPERILLEDLSEEDFRALAEAIQGDESVTLGRFLDARVRASALAAGEGVPLPAVEPPGFQADRADSV